MAKKGKRQQQRRKQGHKPKPATAPAPSAESAKAEPAKAEPAKAGPTKITPGKVDEPASEAPSLGKQRRDARRLEREVHKRAAPAHVTASPIEDPAFFYGFDVTWAKLVIARVVVFTVLAYDALKQISHAPRYGAGDFNVAQLPGFDLIAPGRELYSVGQLVTAYLLVLAACGVATRVVLPIVTVLYGWLYFGSHLDSYQHHYLVWLLLVLSCFVPWQRPFEATPATRVRSWALRLILIQLAVLYFWAAVSKMNTAWVDGRTLDAQIAGKVEAFIKGSVGYPWAAKLVIVGELVLAATIWHRRGWWVALPVGLWLHITILVTDLDIGLFAWLMIGLYTLVLPDGIWVWLADLPPVRSIRAVANTVAHWFHGSARFVVWVVAAGAGAVLAMLSRFDHGPAIGLALVLALIVGTLFAVFRRRTHVAWLAIAHLLAFVLWTTVDHRTKTASDYYRLWGGSSRRLGDVKTAEAAYRRMTEIAPDDGQGFYQLGRLLLAREAGEEGIAALRRAQTLEPLRARSYVAEARWLATHGKREEAIAKVREATIVDPADHEAKTLLDQLLAQP